MTTQSQSGRHAQAGELWLRAKNFFSCDYLVDWNGAPFTLVHDTTGPLSSYFELGKVRYRVAADVGNGSTANVLKTLFSGIAGKKKYALFTGADTTHSRAQAYGISKAGYELTLSGEPAHMNWDAKGNRFVVTMAGETCAALWRSKNSSRSVEGKLSTAIEPADCVLLGLLAMARWETLSRGP